MTRQAALETISKALAVLTHQIRLENSAGFLSKNRLAEDLFLPVLRGVLKAPGLRNLNQQAGNYPYIDLGDKASQVCVQVTTEESAAKLASTLSGFVAQRYDKQYKRLIILIVTNRAISRSQRTKRKLKRASKNKFSFDPDADILTLPAVFKLIAALPDAELHDMSEVISHSVVGEAYIDVRGILEIQSRRQIEYEKTSRKYIPDIFVETCEVKNLARQFAHPTLFFNRTLDSFDRLNIPYWDRFLGKAGLPPLPFPNLQRFRANHKLEEITQIATELARRLAPLTETLSTYEGISKQSPPPRIKPERNHFFEENTFAIQSTLGWGLKRQLSQLLDELEVTRKRVLILTGRAGQGKTNLVCDYVEHFLLKREIPCAYLSCRRLSSAHTNDLGEAVLRSIFGDRVRSFSEAAELLSRHASQTGKPFILVVDGLNEHPRILEFSSQLELFIERALEYPNLKLFLTCRSEFFDLRFGNLTTEPLSANIVLVKTNETRLEPEHDERMAAGYFRFFEVDQNRVSDYVVETLKRDVLLLRFFCEAYGAREKPKPYQQPVISNIYREEIFEKYLDKKLGSAKMSLQRQAQRPSPIDQKADLRAVLESCLKYMLDKWQFANIPLGAVPASLNDALFALLDEEVILRRDAPLAASIFSPSEETINFTFDEFRDFLLAQYLVHSVFVKDSELFRQYIAKTQPNDSQLVEGLKKFIFYISRRSDNEPFWKFYKDTQWYKDVYYREIFNIDPKLLKPEDRDAVVAALGTGGELAERLAVRLATSWHPLYGPLLNLNLLLSYVTLADDKTYDELIKKTFRTIRHINEGTSATAFCNFINDKILPIFQPAPGAPEAALFRFLILLMPVDSGEDLNSLSYLTFRTLLNTHPSYAVGLLRESLSYRLTRHRKFVWRLLSSVPLDPTQAPSLRGEAQTDASESATDDPSLRREATRFLLNSASSVGAQHQK